MIRLASFKGFVPVLFLLLINNGCISEKNKPGSHEIITAYVSALNDSDIKKIDALISDSLTVTEIDILITSDRTEYYTHFQWDSVFNPRYEILEQYSIDDQILELTISKTCQRIEFLHDTPTVYKLKVELHNHQIQKLTTSEFVKFDFEKWQSRRDSLTAWIDAEYPELSGFIFDLSLKGAQNYLQAIDLYKARY